MGTELFECGCGSGILSPLSVTFEEICPVEY